MEQVAKTGENYILCGEIKDAFASFRQLKQKCATSAPLKALDGKLLSDRASVAARWQEHFSTLLNRPTQSPPDALVSEAQASMPDSTIDTFPPTITEVYKAMNKIKAGKARTRSMQYLSGVHPTWWQRCPTHTAQNSHSGLERGRYGIRYSRV